MNRLLVIGGASFDVLHLKDRTVESMGGVGMYTAMAARRCGAQVSMFGPRPDPYPERLQPVAGYLSEWLGPLVSPEQMPRFEISYRQGKTEYLNLFFGAAATVSAAMLAADLSKYDLAHAAQKSDVLTQLSFIQACRQRGVKLISAGTYPAGATERPQAVREVIEQSDFFFMNDLEAMAVFGSLEAARTRAGKVLFITQGAQGAAIIQGETATFIPAVCTTELDPTGAGDTFCGATLAFLLQGKHPIMAARQATALAAEMITQVGPAALLSDDPPPEALADPRVLVDQERVRKVARKIAALGELTPHPFVSPELPPVGHPQALDYFFAATLQQFSFWSTQNNQYHQPLIARIGGVEYKGSDYLWEAYRRGLEQDVEFCSARRQANLKREKMLELFRADDGTDPMPALELHLEQAHSYGQDMLTLELTPRTILDKALASARPLNSFLLLLDKIGGYKEDPLRKKSALLALILNQRRENFLPLEDDEEVPPIIDYHLMRSCLRIGLVDVIDEELNGKLSDRQIVSPAEEWAVRFPAYHAMDQVYHLSGENVSDVTRFFFSSRKRCPEMSEPQCQYCPVDSVCAHRIELFQPVIRTSLY